MMDDTVMHPGAGASRSPGGPHGNPTIPDACVICNHSHSRLVYFGLSYPKNPRYRGYDMYRCQGCDLLFVWPRPADHVLAEIYSDPNYRTEMLVKRPLEECMVEMDVLRRIRKYRKPGRILDVGCGAGNFLGCAQQFGWQGCGVEISRHSAQFARETYDLKIAASLEELDEPAHSFDVVTMIGVIEHLQQPVDFLKSLRRFLKLDGLIFILTDNHRSWMHWLMKEKFPWITPPEHLQLFTPKTIAVLFQSAGFELFSTASMETIFPDAAVRGLSKVFGGKRNANRIAEVVAPTLLLTTLPVRWLLWQANLGAQIYCFGRNVMPSDSAGKARLYP